MPSGIIRLDFFLFLCYTCATIADNGRDHPEATPMPTANPLYAVRCFAPGEFQMAKFSMPDFNVEAVYNLRSKGLSYSCDCPAGQRTVKLKPCKHQRMMPYMLGAVNSDRFYDPETQRWISALPVELTKQGYDGMAAIEPPAAVPTTSQVQAGEVDATLTHRPTIARRI